MRRHAVRRRALDDRIAPGAPTRFRRAKKKNPYRHRSLLESTRTSASMFLLSATPPNVARRSPAGIQGGDQEKPDIRPWWQEIAVWRARIFAVLQEEQRGHPARNLRSSGCSRAVRGRDVYITTEVGQHQMWAAQFFGFEETAHRWMTSGGLGTMGYGLPAALGVQVAHPQEPRD